MKKSHGVHLNYHELKKQFLKKGLEIKVADMASKEKVVSRAELKRTNGRYRPFTVLDHG